MLDRSLTRWQQDALIRKLAVALVCAFSIVAVLPIEPRLFITTANRFLALNLISAVMGLLGVCGLVRAARGDGDFVIAMILMSWPLMFAFSGMLETVLHWLVLMIAIFDLLFHALVPPGILQHLFWGVVQQARQVRNA